MSAVAVIGAKMSGTQQKADQAWDWLKRVWLAWGIINGRMFVRCSTVWQRWINYIYEIQRIMTRERRSSQKNLQSTV